MAATKGSSEPHSWAGGAVGSHEVLDEVDERIWREAGPSARPKALLLLAIEVSDRVFEDGRRGAAATAIRERPSFVYDDRRERRSSRRDAKGQGLAVA